MNKLHEAREKYIKNKFYDVVLLEDYITELEDINK